MPTPRKMNPASIEALRRNNAARSNKPKCSRGHDRTAENTHVSATTGRKRCLPCRQENDAERQRAGKTKHVRTHSDRFPDLKVIDPVAIMRAANGDRPAYDAMTTYEKWAMWEFIYLKEGHDGSAPAQLRLGMPVPNYTENAYTYAAERRLATGHANPIPELDFWEHLYRGRG